MRSRRACAVTPLEWTRRGSARPRRRNEGTREALEESQRLPRSFPPTQPHTLITHIQSFRRPSHPVPAAPSVASDAPIRSAAPLAATATTLDEPGLGSVAACLAAASAASGPSAGGGAGGSGGAGYPRTGGDEGDAGLPSGLGESSGRGESSRLGESSGASGEMDRSSIMAGTAAPAPLATVLSAPTLQQHPPAPPLIYRHSPYLLSPLATPGFAAHTSISHPFSRSGVGSNCGPAGGHAGNTPPIQPIQTMPQHPPETVSRLTLPCLVLSAPGICSPCILFWFVHAATLLPYLVRPCDRCVSRRGSPREVSPTRSRTTAALTRMPTARAAAAAE